MPSGHADDGLAEAARRIEDTLREDVDYLDLSGLNLTTLPDNIHNLRKTRHIDLSNNQLADIPESVCSLIDLKDLDLSQNELTSLNESITQLSKLERLNLGGNPLSALPHNIGDLTRLQELRIYDNEITELPEAISGCMRLQFLDLHGNRLRSLPNTLGKLTHLMTLNVAINRLTMLPDNIINIVRLTYLDVSKNYVADVHLICELTQLKVLYLLQNAINHIPNAIRQLSKLSTLSLANNNLIEIPDCIAELQGLRALYLDRNQIYEIPDMLGKLIALEELYINDNNLKFLPRSLCELRNLRILNVAGNQLQELPENLRDLASSLHTFIVDPNPCVSSFPREIVAKGTPSDIIDLYFTATRERKPLNEAKVVLVGYEGVGKTSLLKCVLLGEQFDKDEPPTPGVKITPCTIALPDGDEALLRIWDFGGQEIYHAMNGFFLTERAVYLLVLNGRREREVEPDAEHWLRLIERFAANSPVIIILTKINSSPFTINRRALRGKYEYQGIRRDRLRRRNGL